MRSIGHTSRGHKGTREVQTHRRPQCKGYTEMCRNIKPLFNFDPPASEEEIRAASLQFVRTISGFPKPSRANETAFNLAVADISRAASQLLGALESHALAKNREDETAKAMARSPRRFGR